MPPLKKSPLPELIPPRDLPGQRVLLFCSAILLAVALLLVLRFTRRMNPWFAIPTAGFAITLAISVGVWVWQRTRGVYCPRCHSPRAKRIYVEEQGSSVEYVACPDCDDRYRTDRNLAKF